MTRGSNVMCKLPSKEYVVYKSTTKIDFHKFVMTCHEIVLQIRKGYVRMHHMADIFEDDKVNIGLHPVCFIPV